MDKPLPISEMAVRNIKNYRDNFDVFARNCLRVRDHDTAKILPFKFRKPQQILHTVTEMQKKELGMVRILNLKARRYGGSTYVEGRFYWLTSLNSNRNAFIVAHEEESTNTLFRMAQLFHEQNALQRYKPSTRKSNAKELIFDKEDGTGLKSEYRLATAKNVHAGKSQGIHYLHDSEEAQWQGDPDELLTSLFACVPDDNSVDTEIFRESTAQGYGNTFQEDVFEAYAEGKFPYYEEDGVTYAWTNPNTEWILVFIPWFVVEKYSREFDSDEKKQAFEHEINQKVYDEKEHQWVESEASKLRRKFKLTLEQLYWRKWAIDNKCRGSEDKFKQNYPSTVEEAFLSSGSNVYSKELCDQLEENCVDPIVIGDLREEAGKVRVRRNKFGKFSLWEWPEEHKQYILVVDSGGGKKQRHEKEKKDPDPTCIDVYDFIDKKQVAQWHGHIEYDLIADMVEQIGKMYNKGMACVELQNHGYTVVADLKRKNYPQYEWKPDEPGWVTSGKTKPLMVDGLYKWARDSMMHIKCKQTVSEMRTFIEENGKFNAASGCHDERVDTAGIATQMFQILPSQLKKHAEKTKRGSFHGFRNIVKRAKPKETGYTEYYTR